MTRLQRAAAFLRKLADEAAESPDSDPSLVGEVRAIADVLSESTRTDLGKAVWHSVLTVLKIKSDLNLTLALVLTQAEGNEF